MGLPDVSAALSMWSQSVSLKTAVTTTVDFEIETVITSKTIKAVVQVADKTKLNPDMVDWSLRYVLAHSTSSMSIGQYIEYGGINYKVVDLGNYDDYGYYRAVGEQVKGNIK